MPIHNSVVFHVHMHACRTDPYAQHTCVNIIIHIVRYKMHVVKEEQVYVYIMCTHISQFCPSQTTSELVLSRLTALLL